MILGWFGDDFGIILIKNPGFQKNLKKFKQSFCFQEPDRTAPDWTGTSLSYEKYKRQVLANILTINFDIENRLESRLPRESLAPRSSKAAENPPLPPRRDITLRGLQDRPPFSGWGIPHPLQHWT